MHDHGNDVADRSVTYDCPSCGEPRLFEWVLELGEVRTSTDEWACSACGEALFIDPALHAEVSVPRRQARAA